MGYFSTNRKLLSINSGDELCKGKTTMGSYSTRNTRNNCNNLKHAVKSEVNPGFTAVRRRLSDIYKILGRNIPDKLQKYANDKAIVSHILPNNGPDMFVIELIGKGIYIKIPNTDNKPITSNMKKKLKTKSKEIASNNQGNTASKPTTKKNSKRTSAAREIARAILSTVAPV